jgi:hypothetical protein
MSEQWAERIRHTNQLVRAVARYVLVGSKYTPDQLYGLCKLTWITDSYAGDAASYIRSTKIPALGHVFVKDFSKLSLDEVAAVVVELTDDESLKSLIVRHTGFTNLYNAYRNTARPWMHKNFKQLAPLFEAAYTLKSDEGGSIIVHEIEQVAGIPKANHEKLVMHPEYLLTPAFASLDQRLRFPLINGNDGVLKLLKKLKVKDAPLHTQYESMIALYGVGGITDSADLDQVGRDIPDFVAPTGTTPKKQLLRPKPIGDNSLPLKDEDDIVSLQGARDLIQRRIHNTMTNRLCALLSKYTLLEGGSKSAMFDALVKNYNGKGDDLLVEVKSSAEDAHVRMAIGQLYAYAHHLSPAGGLHLAVLLPQEPEPHLKKLLDWLSIGIMWLTPQALATSSVKLKGLAIDG